MRHAGGHLFRFLGSIDSKRAGGDPLPTWIKRTPSTTPLPRSDAAMVYDAYHGQVVLFGGFGQGGYLNDTWIWDGINWIQQTPGTSPSPRYDGAIAYDASTGQVLLFGGPVSPIPCPGIAQSVSAGVTDNNGVFYCAPGRRAAGCNGRVQRGNWVPAGNVALTNARRGTYCHAGSSGPCFPLGLEAGYCCV